jgi:ribosomal protein S18 acetylase RimI-like enzyme
VESQYAIREARNSDFDVLVEFTIQEATETEEVHPDSQAVAVGVGAGLDGSTPTTYWVAESDDGTVAGSISIVTEWSNFRGGYYWWVQSLYITPEHRGKGLAERLLAFVTKRARENGAIDLRLYVLHANQRAIAAYRQSGFEIAPYTIMVRHFDAK